MAEMKNILVLGSGLMGSGIGQVALMAGYNVTMVDVDDKFVNSGVAKIEEGLKKLCWQNVISQAILLLQ
jgi:3-hydroxyacyl-CoA dehydrogenase